MENLQLKMISNENMSNNQKEHFDSYKLSAEQGNALTTRRCSLFMNGKFMKYDPVLAAK